METMFLVALTVAELIVIFLVLLFFFRLRRSEHLLSLLQSNQNTLMERLARNAELEHDLVATFAQRQEQLQNLTTKMDDRIRTLRRLLEQAEGITRSPHFLREVILNCRKKGQSPEQISQTTGLARDEVELILARELKNGANPASSQY